MGMSVYLYRLACLENTHFFCFVVMLCLYLKRFIYCACCNVCKLYCVVTGGTCLEVHYSNIFNCGSYSCFT